MINYLNKFYELMSSNDPTYRLATSYHTIINIEFINGTGGLLTNFSAFIDKRDGDGFNSIPFLVQKADLPNIKSTIKDGIVTPFGFISVTSNQPVIPEQNSFKIHFFNTEFSIMENFWLNGYQRQLVMFGYIENIHSLRQI